LTSRRRSRRGTGLRLCTRAQALEQPLEKSALSSLIGADKLGDGEDVVFECALELPAARARGHRRLARERAEAKEVSVQPIATRRTRSPVGDLPEVIATLTRCALTLSQAAVIGADPPSKPVRKRAYRCVRVMTISASETASAGTARHSNGGERPSPAHEYRRGIGCPAANALLLSSTSVLSTTPA
jgi:hypothetical protein